MLNSVNGLIGRAILGQDLVRGYCKPFGGLELVRQLRQTLATQPFCVEHLEESFGIEDFMVSLEHHMKEGLKRAPHDAN